MLRHQSLKSIHYRTLLISQNKKTTDLRVKTWGGIKDMLSPHVKTWGGYITPTPPPQDLRPCYNAITSKICQVLLTLKHITVIK